VPLNVASRDKTAFTVPGRQFGLCNATSTMSRLMDKVVPAHLRNGVFIYLDDLLVISASFERHLEVLREVALHIRRANQYWQKSLLHAACALFRPYNRGRWNTHRS